MERMRWILSFLIVVLLLIHYHYFTLDFQEVYLTEVIMKQIALSTLSISALIIVLSTFFYVDIDLSGKLCYDPNNFYWKNISKIANLGAQTKLCKMYWLTVIVVFIGYFLLGMTISACLIIHWIIKTLIVALLTTTFTRELLVLAFYTSCVTFVACIIFTVTLVKEKYNNKIINFFIYTFGILLAINVLLSIIDMIIYPLLGFMLELATSTNSIVMVISTLFFSIISIYLIMKIVFKFSPMLKNTPLGKLYANSEEDFCPTIYACNLQARR